MSSDNQDGIIWILGCLIVLTLSGVFLSILVDKRFSFQRQNNTLQARLDGDAETIRGLQTRIGDAEAGLASSATSARVNRTKLEARETGVQAVEAQIGILKRRKEELILTIPETRAEYRQYRADYRAHTWTVAAGEKIDHLFLRTGRQFDSVVITKVTATGLEISHAHGSARIDGRDLSLAMQARFQWFEKDRE